MRRLYNAAALAAVALMLAQAAHAQEIGMVTLKPNEATGEMRADIPARPDGETVYIMRDGVRIATAVIKSSGQPGGAVLTMSPAEAAKVQIGDRISLSPNLSKEEQFPLSAYQPVDTTKDSGSSSAGRRVPPSLSSVLSGSAEASLPPLRPTPKPVGADSGKSQAEKSGRASRPAESAPASEPVVAVSPRLTPRASEIPLYPAPAVVPEAGVLGPYGVGLAAAAPVGTPYLRSPAFAGPPTIYMPQTVNRVLLPSVTPYPANIQPPVRYPYASAPFTRTDIYVNLPYGTYYWPNGYAGTTPVEPQIPVYVTAPATAVLTSEAAYTTQRYAPGAAYAETLNPITVPPVAAAGPAVEAQIVPVARVGGVATTQPSSVAASPAGADTASAGPGTAGSSLLPGAPTTGVAPAPAVLPPLEPLNPFPSSGATGAPEPAALTTPGEMPSLPSAPDAAAPAVPPTNTTLPAPLAPLPPLSPAAPAPAAPADGATAVNPFAGESPAGLPPLPPASAQ